MLLSLVRYHLLTLLFRLAVGLRIAQQIRDAVGRELDRAAPSSRPRWIFTPTFCRRAHIRACVPSLLWQWKILKRFQILNNRHAFFFAQLVAVGVAAIAAAGLRCVVDLAILNRRQLARVGLLRQQFHLPAQLTGIIRIEIGAVGAREQLGPGLGIEDVIDGGRRAVMEIRRRRPDAVQRRRLIAVGFLDGIIFVEPALGVVIAELPRDAVETNTIGADLVYGHNLVGIGPLLAIGSVAARTVGEEQLLALGRQGAINRQRILRRGQRQQIGANVLEIRFG